MADRALGELLRMHARLGHADLLEALHAEVRDRPLTGAATEYFQGSQEGLWQMRHNPGVAYLCGPMALRSLLLKQGVASSAVAFLEKVRSGEHGTNLKQIAGFAEKAGFAHRLVERPAGTDVPVPSVVHWKVHHFAAIVEKADGLYHVVDPTFGSSLWVTQEALDAEASGFFLTPAA